MFAAAIILSWSIFIIFLFEPLFIFAIVTYQPIVIIITDHANLIWPKVFQLESALV